jgi:rRNA biogenesis protein RRP5
VKGSLVLGQVCEINPLEVTVALPNSLTGHIPITAISDVLSRRIEADMSASSDHEEQDHEDILSALFTVGQHLRVSVTSTFEDSSSPKSTKPRRHIELTSEPRHTNKGLSAADIIINSTVMAAVASVEDHGLVMDLGLADLSVRGFLPAAEMSPTVFQTSTKIGAVLLCLVTSKAGGGKIIQLSALPEKLGAAEEASCNARNITSLLPGTVVDITVAEVGARGLVGKVLGHMDATADLAHCGAWLEGSSPKGLFKVGSRLLTRIICTFPAAATPKLGISLLPNVLSLSSQQTGLNSDVKLPLDILPVSSIVERCTVLKTEGGVGLWVDVGIAEIPAFVHISRIKDGKAEAIFDSSGPFKVGSTHRGRVTGYSPLDGVYLVSFEQRILDLPFLRIQDVPVGSVVNGTVTRLIVKEHGVFGLIVDIGGGISGLVPELHLADVQLQHPEKKFREGMKVRARVLSTDVGKHQLRLTLKKTLVNSDAALIRSYDEAVVGQRTLGTVMQAVRNGALVQLYGSVRAFLPLSEMSEVYINDAADHFPPGRVVTVYVMEVNAETNRLVVSCKDPSAFGIAKQRLFAGIKAGDIVNAVVAQTTADSVVVELAESGLKATMSLGHISDSPSNRNGTLLKRLRIGQALQGLVVLEKNDRRRALTVSRKSSLVSAAREGGLLANVADAAVGSVVPGFVRNLTPTAAFVQFAAGITALLPGSFMPPDMQKKVDFGLEKAQSLSVKIISNENGRLVASIPSATANGRRSSPPARPGSGLELLIPGTIVKARITAVKETQLNVELEDRTCGRIDVSEVFDEWDHIPNPDRPLERFHQKQVVTARVLGVHNARSHRYLPLTHRTGHAVLELSVKPKTLASDAPPEPLSLKRVELGSSWLGFVNSHGNGCIWVSLSPAIRGRVSALEASNDINEAGALDTKFPIASAIRVRVVGIDLEQRRLDLSARPVGSTDGLSWDIVQPNMVMPGRVIKVTDRQIIVHLSATVSGPIELVDMNDDYDETRPTAYSKQDILRVAVVAVDRSNKRIRLSSRPSRTLNSSLPVRDREVSKPSDIQLGEIVRGFVSNATDKGLFVALGGAVTGFVRVSDLSDGFINEWHSSFPKGRLVKGRVMKVEPVSGHVQLNLRASVVETDHAHLLELSDFRAGQRVRGKVRKVEVFGAFITIERSANISGLCHRSEMAEQPVQDATKVYKEGDSVMAKILAVDLTNKRINLGLKPSYFSQADDEQSEIREDKMQITGLNDDDAWLGAETQDDDKHHVNELAFRIHGTDDKDVMPNEPNSDADINERGRLGGLAAGSFDWSAGGVGHSEMARALGAGGEKSGTTKSQRTEGSQMHLTGEMEMQGPKTAADYEEVVRQQPQSSAAWTAYMALELQAGDLARAREVAERAIKTMDAREESEVFNIWAAYMSLEMTYGSGDSFDEVFHRARHANDEQEVLQRVASMFVRAGKHEVSLLGSLPPVISMLTVDRKRRRSLSRSSRSLARAAWMYGPITATSYTRCGGTRKGRGYSINGRCRYRRRRRTAQ